MNKKQVFCSSNWGRRLSILLAVTLVLPVMAVTPAQAPTAARVQPVLLQMALAQPEARVGVIVQKAVKDTRFEELVARLGGTVTQDLSIINAFAAEIRAKDVAQLASAEGVRWVSWDAPVQQAVNPHRFTTWATKTGQVVRNGFTNAANVPSPVGINATYAYGANVKGAFGGFMPEYEPGLVVSKVEVLLRLYTSASLGTSEIPKLVPYVSGQASGSANVLVSQLNGCVGASNAKTLFVDITALRAWKWSDFKTLEILIDQSLVAKTHKVYYDAVGLRITTAIGTDSTSPLVLPSSVTETAIDASVLTNTFNKTVRATDIWNEAPYRQGAGVTVAVVDSGNFRTNGIGSRLIGEVNFNSAEHTASDQYGHGTFVTGLIADDGSYSAGTYIGTAPKVNILGVRVSDDNGMSTESDVVSALQWIYQNKAAYNIKVANLSLNSSVTQSYHTSPLDAACEILWFNGIVVVASAGNNGTANLYPPANDPFVITVGATDEMATVSLADDVVASFSAYGVDEAGQVKPDLVAPGRNLIAYLPENNTLTISTLHPENRIDNYYFRMSGTSMSAPLVSGAAAILLEDEPNLTPDQVKYRLKVTANTNWPGYTATKAGAGILDVYAAVKGTSPQSANTHIVASHQLWTGSTPVNWGSVDWNSVDWNSVDWNSVDWNSVDWNSVDWNSDYWGP